MDSKDQLDQIRAAKELREQLRALSSKVGAANRVTQQASKAVTAAAKVTQAVATLLDFDEINKLKEKTVSASSGTTRSKEKTEGSALTKTLDDLDLWTRFGFSVEDMPEDDTFVTAGKKLVDKLGEGISGALGNALDWVRRMIWEPIKSALGLLGALPMGVTAVLTNTAQSLWTAFSAGWQSGGSRLVQIGNNLVNTAATLWNKFSTGWGSRGVSIHNSLLNAAVTLWSKFSAGWGSRSVKISNTLTNTASTLWTQFKNGWSGKTLGLKITYATNVGAVKRAVYQALGLSGWPTISFAARGGVFSSATLTMLGEAGTEAVVPLENNTGWMDVMAQKLGERMGFAGSVTVPVYIGGEKVAEHVVRAINDTTRRTGVSPLYV